MVEYTKPTGPGTNFTVRNALHRGWQLFNFKLLQKASGECGWLSPEPVVPRNQMDGPTPICYNRVNSKLLLTNLAHQAPVRRTLLRMGRLAQVPGQLSAARGITLASRVKELWKRETVLYPTSHPPLDFGSDRGVPI